MTKFVLCLMIFLVTAASIPAAVYQQRGGIGVQITVKGEWPVICGVFDDTPASRAKLMTGDRIVAIDAKTTRDRSLQEILGQLASNAGDKVTLTIRREENGAGKTFEIALTSQALSDSPAGPATPAKRLGPVQFNGNKIVSRVLPYQDLVSLFVRLPIAHAVVTGSGVKVAVVRRADPRDAVNAVRLAAPEALISAHAATDDPNAAVVLGDKLNAAGCRIAVILDAHRWPRTAIEPFVKRLLSAKVAVLIPSDLSEDKDVIETINRLHAMGAMTVGRVNRQSQVMEMTGRRGRPFNRSIRDIKTDVFSTVGMTPRDRKTTPVATAAGVAALVLEKWPRLKPSELREKIVAGARSVWQGTSIEYGRWLGNCDVNPTTTEYKPRNESAVFRFRVLDAAAAVGVDTKIPWFLNMLNCQKAWKITKGRGTVAVVSDQGFHVKHPELDDRIRAKKHFGHVSFERPRQNFHGTDMARILLAVAPEAEIIPVLCSARSIAGLPRNITRSFEFAAEQKADVVTASWSGKFAADSGILAAVRKTTDSGAVVSWFHFPEQYPGVLRPSFTYSTWYARPRIGFADRFLTDPAGFHPVEIEAGLSGTAPQAAGLALLVKSVNPRLTPRRIERLIFDNSTPIGNGKVRIPDAYRIVMAAKNSGSESAGVLRSSD